MNYNILNEGFTNRYSVDPVEDAQLTEDNYDCSMPDTVWDKLGQLNEHKQKAKPQGNVKPLNESLKDRNFLDKIAREFTDYCKNQEYPLYIDECYGEEKVPNKAGFIFYDINWGDWKHEHLRSEYLFEQYCAESGYQAFNHQTTVTEEDGSDCYSAQHRWSVINPSSNGEAEESTIKESYSYDDDSLFFKAYVTNLGKYNEGELVGDWFEFPMDEDEFNEKLKEIGVSDEPNEDGDYYEEWFVTDYDTNIPGVSDELGEYVSYDTLQHYGELTEDASSIDPEALSNAMEVVSNLQEAIDGLNSGRIIFYKGIHDWGELAYVVIDELGGVESLSTDEIEQNFDYEKLGEEIDQDDWDGKFAGEYFCGDENASMYDIGQAYVDDQGGIEFIVSPENYFDYDSYGSDLKHYGYNRTEDGFIYYE